MSIRVWFKWFHMLIFMLGCKQSNDHQADSDLAGWRLWGEVRSVKEVHYSSTGKYSSTAEFNRAGYIIEDAVYNPDHSLICRRSNFFSDSGRREATRFFVQANELAFVIRYKYDRKGHLISAVKENAKGVMITRTDFRYDESGHKVSEVITSPKGNKYSETEIFYTDDFITKEIHYDSIMNRRWKQFNMYKATGQKTETILLSMNDSLLCRFIYKYFARQLKERSEIGGDGKLINKTIFSYNDHGDEKQVARLSHHDKMEDLSVIEYKYDDRNNWIFKTITVNGEVEDIITREIQYYK